MKYSLKRALAVLIALLLALPTFAYAEAPADGSVEVGTVEEGQLIQSNEIDQPVEEVVFELGGDAPEDPDEAAETPTLDVDDLADDFSDPTSVEPAVEEELPAEDEAEEPIEGEAEEPAEQLIEGETEEPAGESAAFVATQGVVTVSAAPGVFPEGAVLTVSESEPARMLKRSASKGETIAASYAYEITVTDAEGNPVQPAEGTTATVAFALSEANDPNLSSRVLHEGTEIASRTEDGAVLAETTGFSKYTVEFYYNEKAYVLAGDASVVLSEILAAVGLTGEVTDVAVSDEDLFSASSETGEWIVTAHQAFDTEEWLTVTIGGIAYDIAVTDDEEITTWAELQTALDAGGIVPLTQDLTAGSDNTMLEVSGTVTLDLNGCTLNRNRSTVDLDGHVPIVNAGGSLTVIDRMGSGTITGGFAHNGGGINNKGTLNISGVTITGNHVTKPDGNGRGAGIYNNGVLVIDGTVLSGNTGENGGGIVNCGEMSLTDCTVSDNSAKSDGDGVWTESGLTLTRCTLSGNTSKGKGGGLYVKGESSAVDCAFTGNIARDGAGIYIYSS